MCLIIHKPKGVDVPLELLRSAIHYNPDGFGVMAFSGRQPLNVKRQKKACIASLYRAYRSVAEHECVIHLRLKTRGEVTVKNLHPFRVAPKVYMAHNGTLGVPCRIEGRSDSWHAANDYLAPVLQKDPGILHDQEFLGQLENWIGPDNRLVFMDAHRGKTVIVNRDKGIEFNGLWLSNTRWFDAARFGLPQQERIMPEVQAIPVTPPPLFKPQTGIQKSSV